MAQLDEDSWKVVAAAQRFVRSGDSLELESFDLRLLKKADYQLSDRDVNTGWRRAIQDQIRSKENTPDLLEVKPEAFGIKIDLNELFKRIMKRLK